MSKRSGSGPRLVRHRRKGGKLIHLPDNRQRQYRSDSAAYKFSQKVDWETWRDEFFSELGKDGTYLYQTVAAFARAKARGNETKRRWIMAAIGQVPSRRLPYVGNWTRERYMEMGRTDVKVQALQKKVDQELDLLGACKDVAQDFAGNWFARLEQQLAEIYELDGGRLVPEMPETVRTKDEKKDWRKWMQKVVRWKLGQLNLLMQMQLRSAFGWIQLMSGMHRPALIQQTAQFLKGAGEEKSASENPALALMIETVVRTAKAFGRELPPELEELRDKLELEAAEKEKNVTPTKIDK